MKRAFLTMLLLGSTALAEAEEAPKPGSAEPSAPSAPTSPAPDAAPPAVVLEPVVVSAPPPLSSSSELYIPGQDFELRPQGRPADILRLVPGLVIGQHQGGGQSGAVFPARASTPTTARTSRSSSTACP